MNSKLLQKLEELKLEIVNSDEYKKLKEIESILNNDETVIKLAYQKDMASVHYEDSIKHFGENSTEAQQAQKKLYEAKLALDKNKLVIKYNEQFKIVRKMYVRINEELFNPFK